MAYSVALVEQGALAGALAPDHAPATGVCPSDKLAPTRWARVRVTTDTTSYSTGGLALNVLAVLTGWTGIARWYSNRVKWSTTTYYADLVVPNHGTAGSRLVKILNASTNAEHAASASTASVFDMWVSGW